MNAASLSIYLAGLLQGITLVAFPAASTILTAADAYHLTHTQYGSLFIPQALFSIFTALLNPWFCRTFGLKKTFLAGLLANFLSMLLLLFSAHVMHDHQLAIPLLMGATSCLGLGFGTLVPTLNRMVEVLNPQNSDSAVLLLNAVLGVGTTLAPLFIALFTHLGFWWGLPLTLSIALLTLLLSNLLVKLPEEPLRVATHSHTAKLSALGYMFIAFAFLYGMMETLNGNWVSIYMKNHVGASPNLGALALTAFWGMVTFGRLFFSATSKVFSEALAFQIAPFISAIAFVIIASLVSGQGFVAVIAFGLIGFGCSVLLPLLISFGGKELGAFAAAVPGMIISSYLLGYGVAAFGVGPLQEFADISLRSIYLMGACIACILGFLSIYIIQKQTREVSHESSKSLGR